ncbi:MAG: adenylate/guanylate cyclase domain-containing protein [Alphaproteobacteria bacterium]|nr:adenylate/guanylate cyclase domain-containing protein [Alphaproteobacteria bacterium]
MAKDQRRLTSILAADVVGYSRLVAADESGTVRALRACRALIDPLIARHGGRIFGTAGDSVLAEFGSVVDALSAAIDLQIIIRLRQAERPEAQRIVYRIGVAVGDVMVEGDNLLGDGVNIAARLEGLAEPGGIVIAGNVREQVEGKLKLAFDDLGEQALKNIPRPVRAHRVRFTAEAMSAQALATSGRALSRNRETPFAAIGAGAALLVALGVLSWAPWRAAPSSLPATAVVASRTAAPVQTTDQEAGIAVLAFTNSTGDPEQEYFSDGISDDILTGLSRFSGLKVISRNSSFRYKGQNVDIKQVGRELGVGYVLEGSVRRDGDKIRVTAQLIETATGAHLWAERYDRPYKDIFAVQDEITQKVVSSLAAYVDQAERKAIAAKGP